MNFMTFHILGMALSQLTSIFFRRVQTTKQLRFMTYVYSVEMSRNLVLVLDDIRYRFIGIPPFFALKGYHSLAGMDRSNQVTRPGVPGKSTGNKFV